MLIFEDVTEDFSDLSTILQHFESWRNRDIGSYKDTYFSLCLPKVSENCPIIASQQFPILKNISLDYWPDASFEYIDVEST